MPKSAPKIPVTAKGPGVGGTNICVACNPIAKAIAIVVMLTAVSLDILFAKGDNKTYAESQNTGIETKYPVAAKPKEACFFPVIRKIVCAIVSTAPLFSSNAPITVPMAMTIPIPEIVPPNPVE